MEEPYCNDNIFIGMSGIPFNIILTSGEEMLASSEILEIEELPSNIAIPEVDEERLKELEDILDEKIFEDINDLNEEQYQNFMEAVNVEVELAGLPTEEDKEVYRNGLINLYNSNSDVYNDVEGVTEQVIQELDENHSSPLDNITGEDVLAFRIRVSNKIVAAGINLGVSLLIGGIGSGAVRAVIKRYGSKKAQTSINRAIVGRLTVWGIKQAVGLNLIAQLVFTVIKNVLDPGSYFAKQIDRRDRKPNNGYIDF